MSESLGLSIGVANLVAARVGSAPVTRRSVLTIFDHRAGEVGLPEENPNLNEPGLVMRGFVERVGDRSPLVAADGTKYLGEVLTVEALEAMARTVGYGTPVAIAVPAYWSEGQSAALRDEFFAQPGLAPNGVPPLLISDATAALTALYAKPGFPTDGFVALCDFGASGTSVTLTNAASNFQQIGSSVRYTDFAGDEIDQLIANHLRAGAPDADTTTDLASTARMGSQTRLLSECRRAKEELSAATVTTIPTGSGGDIRLSRTEFEQLISGPLDRFVSTVEDVLQRNGIPRANLAAVATVGGGASIPLLSNRLSERLQVPIFTTPQPAFSAAIGAAVLGQQQSSAGAATAAGAVVETPTELVGTPPTQVAPSAWAAQAGDDDKSATYRALAWSQDAATGDEPVPYTGRDATGEYSREATESDYAAGDRYAAEPGPLPWYKRTALVVSVAAAGAAVLVAVVLALTLGNTKTNPVNTTPPNQPAPPQTSQTVTITGPNNSPTVTVIPPPPTSNATQPPATTTSATAPPTTTTTQPTTTAAPTSSQVTTTAAPTTSQQTTTAAPITPTHRGPFEPPFRR
jgi:Hsp70 protein